MVALKARASPSRVGKPSKDKVKRHRRTTSLILLTSYSSLPDLNTRSPAKTVPLDIFVWGSGSMCELGLGPAASTKEVKRPRLNPFLSQEALGGTKIVDFAVGGIHVIALDGKGRVWSWGGNDLGVLGRDTLKVPEALKDMADGGDLDDEDGDLNQAESIPALVEGLPDALAGGPRIVQLAATDNLSAVLYDNGDVYAWGCFRCNEGMLGFLRLEIAIQRLPLKISEYADVVQIAAGKDHLLALDAKGVVTAWGNGQQSQLGRRISERQRLRTLEPQQFGLYDIKYVASGDFHCFAIDTNDNVFAWGLNQFGQCGITDAQGNLEDGLVIHKPTKVPELSQKGIVAIDAGEHHTLALTSEGKVYSWGRYDMKEIGIAEDKLPDSTFRDEHGRPRSVPVPTILEIGKKPDQVVIGSICAGLHHSFAVTTDGVVYAWGFADTYAPGLGPLSEDVAVPTRIVNTATKFYDIKLIGAGGQFSVSGGVKIANEDDAEDRNDKYDEIDGL